MKAVKNISISVEVQQLISGELAHHYNIIPAKASDETFTFYISEKVRTEDSDEELELLLGKKINFIPLEDIEIKRLLSVYYRKSGEVKNQEEKKFSVRSNDFLEQLIFEAKELGSSDIHFEVFEDTARVRIRIDGILVEKYVIEKANYLELVNKIKIKSNLDITEKRLPQDGRINYDDFDIRVSILPTLHGEKIVMRILGHDASNIEIEKLGFEEEEKQLYLQAVKKSNGIVLISGPTGSGKTTTLYATLKLLNHVKSNIVTVEDPIEYTLKGINQVQLKEDIGLTFSSALRSFLRQDPDIIMLGEIRDSETAKMAIRASLTGHLVLSTIHTNSALGTISRLIDMGVPSFLLAETLNISVAQRLVRKLCAECKEERPFDPEELPTGFEIPFPVATTFIAKGCSSCHYTGYRGRRAIYELVPIDTAMTNRIKRGEFTEDHSDNKQIKTLSEKAFQLLASGETALEEVYSILINT